MQPHARLSAGVDYTRSEIVASTGSGSDQTDWSPTGQLGLGFTLRTPTRLLESSRGKFASVSIGLKFDAGYSLLPSTTIKVADATVGEFKRSGLYIESALVLRF